jgi:Domain of unknown function (DUF4375)
MTVKQPAPVKPLEEIWELSQAQDFNYELTRFLWQKQDNQTASLTQTEHAFELLSSMGWQVATQGFQDLFFQQYTLSDCVLVEQTLREIGAIQVAELFGEAKEIYSRHKTDLSEEEFQSLNPFDFSEPDGSRFDEIANIITENDLLEFDESLAAYARKHWMEFSA